jgi:hypothetical protein
MTPDGATFSADKLPFKIPCPPPALRLPPPVSRMSPEIQRKATSLIPSPPLGTRVPGDRILWSPLVFPQTLAHQATFASIKAKSESEANHSKSDSKAAGETFEGVPERQADSVDSDSIETFEDVVLEDFPLIESSEAARSDSSVSPSVLEISTVEMATPNAESISLMQKAKTLPLIEPPRPLICLDDDLISVADLAKKLELKACQVINSLIDIGISTNPGDTIDVKTASQIAERFGLNFKRMPHRPSDEDVTAGIQSDCHMNP